MDLFLITFATFLIVGATVAMHYEILRYASFIAPHLTIQPRMRIVVIIIAAFIGHVLQITLYAIAYWAARFVPGAGGLEGGLEGDAVDYFYYSAATFTTLGVGDITPVGHLRIMSGVESLNGLILITWSASFTYLAMERFWVDQPITRTRASSTRSQGASPSPRQDPPPRKQRGQHPHE